MTDIQEEIAQLKAMVESLNEWCAELSRRLYVLDQLPFRQSKKVLVDVKLPESAGPPTGSVKLLTWERAPDPDEFWSDPAWSEAPGTSQLPATSELPRHANVAPPEPVLHPQAHPGTMIGRGLRHTGQEMLNAHYNDGTVE